MANGDKVYLLISHPLKGQLKGKLNQKAKKIITYNLIIDKVINRTSQGLTILR